MRLINAHTIALEEDEVDDHNAPEFAILSHTWGSPREEILFDDLKSWSKSNPPPASSPKSRGWAKLEGTCRLALERGISHVWIDTCCIDKSSSAVLQEAINFMFRWYEVSTVCFAYLVDVQRPPPEGEENWALISEDYDAMDWDSRTAYWRLHKEITSSPDFRGSRWFTRGWTLQELLAPLDVRFFDRDWRYLGSRARLREYLAGITGIPKSRLDDTDTSHPEDQKRRSRHNPGTRGFSKASVAEKMSWASKRVTTRREDMAYCLLGLFGVFMPMIYGEGDHAFRRLQEEIIKMNDDSSILIWGYGRPGIENGWDRGSELRRQTSIFAPHVRDFQYCGGMARSVSVPLPLLPVFSMQQRGLAIKLPVVEDPAIPRILYGILDLGSSDAPEGFEKALRIAIVLFVSLRSLEQSEAVPSTGEAPTECIRLRWCAPVAVTLGFAERAVLRQLLIRRTTEGTDRDILMLTQGDEELGLLRLPITLGLAREARRPTVFSPGACDVTAIYPPAPLGAPMYRAILETGHKGDDPASDERALRGLLERSGLGEIRASSCTAFQRFRVAFTLRFPSLSGMDPSNRLVVLLSFEGAALHRFTIEPEWLHELGVQVLHPESNIVGREFEELQRLATAEGPGACEGYRLLTSTCKENGLQRFLAPGQTGKLGNRLVIEQRYSPPSEPEQLAATFRGHLGQTTVAFWIEE